MLTKAALAVNAIAALFLAACGPEPAPDAPSFERDVKPITLSRCVRCHGGGGKLQGDPAGYTTPGTPPQGYFDHDEDQGDCTTPLSTTCRYGLRHYASPDGTVVAALSFYIHLPPETDGMPPPPSPRLTERQLAILDAWARAPLP
jgi:hypothetical protein